MQRAGALPTAGDGLKAIIRHDGEDSLVLVRECDARGWARYAQGLRRNSDRPRSQVALRLLARASVDSAQPAASRSRTA